MSSIQGRKENKVSGFLNISLRNNENDENNSLEKS
jgi:hypothetical protein